MVDVTFADIQSQFLMMQDCLCVCVQTAARRTGQADGSDPTIGERDEQRPACLSNRRLTTLPEGSNAT